MENKKTFQKYIFFSIYFESASLAWHLKKEGKDVTFAIVNNLKTVGHDEPEEKDAKERRLGMWKGILNVVKAEDYLAEMEKFENKDDYFVICDFNTLHSYSKKIKNMGFANGLLPTKFDYELEADRNMAKDFVQSFYPDLKVAEVEEFKTIEEGIEMITNSEEFWALKGNDPAATTVVPCTKILEFAKDELISCLTAHKEDYERKGYILERQIRDGVEFCTQVVYYNGKRVAYSVDIENKAFGSGNCGCKVGCAIDMVVAIPQDAPVVSQVFTEAMDKLASRHTGLFYADCNTILKDGELYFLEFCSNRMGYDAIQTECEMAGSVSNYFESIANGLNPYVSKYGVCVRGLNMNKDDKGALLKNIPMRWNEESENHIYPYDMHKDEETGKMMNGGYDYELLSVFTGSSDDVDFAVIKAYEVVDNFSFDEMYYRSMGDFNDRTYNGNILDRLDGIQALIEPVGVEED